jgi:hypothetical protein
MDAGALIGRDGSRANGGMIEQTGQTQADELFWRDNLPAAYVGGNGTADERREALRTAWRASGWPIPIGPSR